MNFISKILLFSILSISFPIGKLFDIFIWNLRITRTEVVFNNQHIQSKEESCYFFSKITKPLKNKLSSPHLFDSLYAIPERIASKTTVQSIANQNKKTNSLTTAVIKRSIFNVVYVDDSGNMAIPSLQYSYFHQFINYIKI
jgi:hypothetical protein